MTMKRTALCLTPGCPSNGLVPESEAATHPCCQEKAVDVPVAYRWSHEDCPGVWSVWCDYGNGHGAAMMLADRCWRIEYAYAAKDKAWA
jgi:hypothetical protein